MSEFNKSNYKIDDLLELMKYLRSENGCPWDREQTHDSIKKNVIEEAYEVLDAIDSKIPQKLYDELGDLLLQVVFHAQIAKENLDFDFDTIVNNLCKKLIFRHSHIFGENKDNASSSSEVLDIWEKNKKKESGNKSQSQIMKEIPRHLPSLERAYKIQKKAKQVGFDWDDRSFVIKKIKEEIDEVEEAVLIESNHLKDASVQSMDANEKSIENNEKSFKDNIELEIGDLLFAVVNYARFLGVNPEMALDKANQKFVKRFSYVETKITQNNKMMENCTLDELDLVWEEAKNND